MSQVKSIQASSATDPTKKGTLQLRIEGTNEVMILVSYFMLCVSTKVMHFCNSLELMT